MSASPSCSGCLVQSVLVGEMRLGNIGIGSALSQASLTRLCPPVECTHGCTHGMHLTGRLPLARSLLFLTPHSQYLRDRLSSSLRTRLRSAILPSGHLQSPLAFESALRCHLALTHCIQQFCHLDVPRTVRSVLLAEALPGCRNDGRGGQRMRGCLDLHVGVEDWEGVWGGGGGGGVGGGGGGSGWAEQGRSHSSDLT